MKVMKDFFSQKLLWGGLLGMIVIVSVFTVGILGSIVDPKPDGLPVALVIEDDGFEMPNQSLHFGKTVQETLTANKDIPFTWTVFSNKEEALNKMDSKSFYATLIIPEHTSENIVSLLQPDSNPPEIEVLINEGMNYTAATAIEQIIGQIVQEMNTQVQDILFNQLEAQSATLSVEQLKPIVNPLHVKKEVANNIESHTANGNTPVLFSQILWLSVFICSLIIFMILKKTTNSQASFSSITSQLLGSLLFLTVIVASLLLISTYILDVNIPNIQNTFLLLLLISFIFFLLQNALFNWIGVIAAPFILLLFLFSIPILNVPVEFLPGTSKSLLHAWIPLRFSAEGLRSLFFFDKNNIWNDLTPLLFTGVGSLIVLILSILKKQFKVEKQLKVTSSN